MDESLSLAQHPDFAVVCSFLSLAAAVPQHNLALDPLSIPQLQKYLESQHEVATPLCELFSKLLRRAVRNFRPNNWEKCLIKFCHQHGHRQDAWELERFGYKKSNINIKLRVLKNLLAYQFECNSKFKNAINKMANQELRFNPIGRDSKGRCYWLHKDHRANIRLYREDQDEETWKVIASDRAGLVDVISSLKSGKSPDNSNTETVLNEDSNSVGSVYNQNNVDEDGKNNASPVPSEKRLETDDDVVKSDVDTENSDSLPLKVNFKSVLKQSKDKCDNSEENSKASNENIKSDNANEKKFDIKDGAETVHKKCEEKESRDISLPEKNREESKGIDDKDCDSALDSKISKTEKNTVSDEIGEEIEENVMIVKGEGNGVDCESLPFYYFSEEIEEEVMYVYGEGSGFDCMAGNPVIEKTSSTNEDNNGEGVSLQRENEIGTDIVESVTSENNSTSGNCTENLGVINEVQAASKENSVSDEASVKEYTKNTDPTEDEVNTKNNQLAPLPVTKRFLQNIPKLDTPSESLEPISNKNKLWTVDSLCSHPSESKFTNNSVDQVGEDLSTKTILNKENNFSDSKDVLIHVSKSSENDIDNKNNVCSDSLEKTDEPTSIDTCTKSDEQISTTFNSNTDTDSKNDTGNDPSERVNVDSSGMCEKSIANSEILSSVPDENKSIESNDLEKRESDSQESREIESSVSKKDLSPLHETENFNNVQIKDKTENGMEHPMEVQEDTSSESHQNVSDVKSENNVEENVQTKSEIAIPDSSVDTSVNSEQIDTSVNISKTCSKHKAEIETASNKNDDSDSLLTKKIKLGDENTVEEKPLEEKHSEEQNISPASSIHNEKTNDLNIEKLEALVENVGETSPKMKNVLMDKHKESSPPPDDDSGISTKKFKSDTLDIENEDPQDVKCVKKDEVKSDETTPSENIVNVEESNKSTSNNQSEKESSEDVSKENQKPETNSRDILTENSVSANVNNLKVSETNDEDIASKNNPSQGVRTRRSESLKDTKVSDIIKLSDSKLEKMTTRQKASDKKSNIEVNEDQSKKNNQKRKRDQKVSESQSDEEEIEPQQSKKRKTKQKKTNIKLRKKVEEKIARDSSSDEEVETPLNKGKKKSPNKVNKNNASSKPKKLETKKHHKQDKAKSNEGAYLDKEEDELTEVPIRQSRRIAQLKIKEEAQRRLMEEMALRELKAQHKKKNLKTNKENKDKDWQHSASEHSSDDSAKGKIKGKVKKNKDDKWLKKSGIHWHSSSGGNETDTEPGEEPEDDLDEQEPEEDILAQKSDHEFSPESDVECGDTAPIRRARTLKKEDGDDDKDVDGGCVRCGKNDHPEWILLCDSCDAGWHASCLQPVLFLVPEGEWFCPPCNHKSLINALEIALKDHDKHVEMVKKEDLNRENSLSNQSETKAEESGSEYNSGEKSENSDETSCDSSSTDSSSEDDDEKIYRLRERRQLPVSYRFKEYDQLISSAIKEEYKEVDNSGAGNQGRGKDISTIIEADKEEKKAMLEAEAQSNPQKTSGDESSRRRQPKIRRRPRKLNSLEVLSEDCDDNSDEDFKEAGWSTSTSEAISSDGEESSSSHSSDSLPLRRSARPAKPKEKRKTGESPVRKKTRRLIINDSSSESNGAKDEENAPKPETENPVKKPKKKKKEKKEGGEDGVEGDEKVEKKVKARIKYGGLSDSSKSSHDWSPAHRTRQRKYNYMELPNTESEDEAHKPSGKHMDSSDEYKGESDSCSDTDSSGEKRKHKSRFFDEDIKSLNASKEAYQKQLESHGSDLLKGSLVPIVKLSDISPNKSDGTTLVDQNQDSVMTPKPKGYHAKRGKRNTKGSFARRNVKKSLENMDVPVEGMNTGLSTADADSITSQDVNNLSVSNHEGGPGEMMRIPIKTTSMTQFQLEREKKRKEKEEKFIEKEKRKQERLQKKEEKQALKEQKAKEREEKKMARLANIEHNKSSRRIRPEYLTGQQVYNAAISGPIPITRLPSNVPNIRGIQLRPNMPPHQNIMNIPNAHPHMPNPIRIRMDHPNYRPQLDNRLMPLDNRDMYNIHKLQSNIQPLKGDIPNAEESSAYMSSENQKVPLPLDHKLQTFHSDVRKPYPGGPRLPLPPIIEGGSHNMEGNHLIRPPHPNYPVNSELPVRNDILIRPPINMHGQGSNIMSLNPEPRQMPPNSYGGSIIENTLIHGSDPGAQKKRGRGSSKKTLTRHTPGPLAPNSEGNLSHPPNSAEGTFTVAGAPQPFRPNVDPPSVITRMPHMMPPPYRGSAMFNNSVPMYGSPRPPLPNHISMSGTYRGHAPHPLDPSPSGGGPISMTSPERSSPHNQYPYQPSSYYPPTSTPPHLVPYPPPPLHGRYPPPPHMSGPPPRSPTPHNRPESTESLEDKSKTFGDNSESVGQFIKSEIKEEPGIKQSMSPTDETEDSVPSEGQIEDNEEHPTNFSTVISSTPLRGVHPQIKHTEGKGERTNRGRMSLTTAARYPQGPYAPQFGPYGPLPGIPVHPPSTTHPPVTSHPPPGQHSLIPNHPPPISHQSTTPQPSVAPQPLPMTHSPSPSHSSPVPHPPATGDAPYLPPPPIHAVHPPHPHLVSQIHRPPLYPPHHTPPQVMTPIHIPSRPTHVQPAEPLRSDDNPNQTSNATNTSNEEEVGEFGGLVSYFSSQQEDDIDT